MDQSPWEANRLAASQKIPSILLNPKFHYLIHKCSPTLPILSQLDPVHTTTFHFLKIHLNIILHSTPVSQVVSFLQVSPKPCIRLSSPIRATCTAHLILLDFITLKILGEQDRPFSSPLCSFIQSHLTSSLWGPNIFLNTLFSNFLSLRSSITVRDQSPHPYKTTGEIIVKQRIATKYELMCFLQLPQHSHYFPTQHQSICFYAANWIFI